MQSLQFDVFSELARWSDGPCVSLYLPLDPKHPSIEADRLLLKDLLGDARHQLESTATLRRPTIDRLLAPVEALLVAEWWPLGGRGYAMFNAPGRSTHLQLDADVPAMAVVADRFVVTPLVAALPDTGYFYLLAISQDRVRLYRGRRDGLVEVEVPDLPASRAEALWYEHHERQLGAHGGAHEDVDRITGTVHGSPSDRDLRKQQLSRFFRIVDAALWGVLHAETAPLVVAGVEYELAIYREANQYPHLAATLDTGNPERLRTDELHAKVWPAAATLLDGQRRKLLQRLSLSSEPLTSMPAILDACQAGRVGALFVRSDHLSWGRAESAEGHSERRPGDVDLVSAAIAAALAQGASIHPMQPGELSSCVDVAALPRY